MIDIVTFQDMGELSQYLADSVTEEIVKNPEIVLGLATGKTFIPIYDALARELVAQEVSAEKVVTFNLDEYVGLASAHKSSFSFYMYEHLWSKLDFTPSRTHIPSGTAVNLEAEAKNYERLIQLAGGIDLQLLGLGVNGHIGFNEPGSSFQSMTRVVELDESTKNRNAADFDDRNVPDRAITVGLETIMKSRKIFLVVTGQEKAEILSKGLEKPDENVPFSVLLNHPNSTLLVDAQAGRLLKK